MISPIQDFKAVTPKRTGESVHVVVADVPNFLVEGPAKDLRIVLRGYGNHESALWFEDLANSSQDSILFDDVFEDIHQKDLIHC